MAEGNDAEVGDYRREHLFTLGQSLAAYRHYQGLIAACDREIEQYLETFESNADPLEEPQSKSSGSQEPGSGRARLDLQSHLYRIFGVDLTRVPGVHTLTAQTLQGEIGPDLSRFASAAAFTSWLGLCPDNRISGGKVLSVKTRKVKNRAATALRMAAQSLYRSQSYLGHYYRRMRAKLGAPKAITAAAHKLARIIYQMVTTRQAYDETICVRNEVQNRQRLEARQTSPRPWTRNHCCKNRRPVMTTVPQKQERVASVISRACIISNLGVTDHARTFDEG